MSASRWKCSRTIMRYGKHSCEKFRIEYYRYHRCVLPHPQKLPLHTNYVFITDRKNPSQVAIKHTHDPWNFIGVALFKISMIIVVPWSGVLRLESLRYILECILRLWCKNNGVPLHQFNNVTNGINSHEQHVSNVIFSSYHNLFNMIVAHVVTLTIGSLNVLIFLLGVLLGLTFYNILLQFNFSLAQTVDQLPSVSRLNCPSLLKDQ